MPPWLTIQAVLASTFPSSSDHLNIGRQVKLATAQGAGKRQLEQPGVRQRLEEQLRQLSLGLDLIGARSDLGSQLPDDVER